MSSGSKSQKRKNKKKYFQSSKKSKCFGLDSGMKGILVTCNDEYKCVKEAYNLLNEFADEMYGPEFEQKTNRYSDDEDDIEAQFARELSAMKSKSPRRFQQVSTKVKGVIFINTTIPDPVSLVNQVFETVIKTGKKKSRFIFKFKPVIITCKTCESDIRKALDAILLQFSAKEKNKELKYKVESKITHNDNITSSHMICYVRDSVKSIPLTWTPCILEPQVVVSFYVLRTVCCISILDKYEKYKKYNLSNAVSSTFENSTCNTVTKELIEIIKPTSEGGNTNEIISDGSKEITSEIANERNSEDVNEITSENTTQISTE